MKLSTSNSDPWRQVHPVLGVPLIDHLFNKLAGMYLSKWTKEFPNDVAIENWRVTWSEGLMKRNISPNLISRGLENCLDMYEWPPGLPEFAKACQTPSRDEQITPPERPALGYEFKFNPELAAKAADAVRVDAADRGDTEWIHRILQKGQKNVSPTSWRMACEAAERLGIKL